MSMSFFHTFFSLLLACWGSSKKNGASGIRVGGGGLSAMNVHERFGNYRCDSTWQLIVSAVQAMKAITGEDIEFLLWTGFASSCFFLLYFLLAVRLY